MSAAGVGEDARVVFGWDVGGAHVKVSLVDADADAQAAVRDVAQWPCALWQGLERLEQTITLVLERWPQAGSAHAFHVVTMTGEMVDLFADRASGVRAIAATLARRLGPRLRFFGGDGWLTADELGEATTVDPIPAWRCVASANWLATARWLATRVGDALLVDIGSTTTDIIPIVGGRVVARGSTDAARLATGELVYHGVVRTPLCAIARRIAFDGTTFNVMNEWFATSADVYRLTGELDARYDAHPSADQGPKTLAGSRARLARMIGRDACDAADDAWLRFAHRWRALQLRELAANLARVAAAHPELDGAPLVGAGCGRFLADALARRHARRYHDFGELAGVPEACAGCAGWAATCAPSVTLALLARDEAARNVGPRTAAAARAA